MIACFSEDYSEYNSDSIPSCVDLHITFVNLTQEEKELIEKFRQMVTAQMKNAAKESLKIEGIEE